MFCRLVYCCATRSRFSGKVWFRQGVFRVAVLDVYFGFSDLVSDLDEGVFPAFVSDQVYFPKFLVV